MVQNQLQTFNASFAGPVTSLCWISLYKNITQAGNDLTPAFAVGFTTGMIGIYRKNIDNISFPLFLSSSFLSSLRLLRLTMALLRTSPSTDTHCDLPVPGWLLSSVRPGLFIYELLISAYLPARFHLFQIFPEPSGLHPYICKGVHFINKGGSLLVTSIPSHIRTMFVPLCLVICFGYLVITSLRFFVLHVLRMNK